MSDQTLTVTKEQALMLMRNLLPAAAAAQAGAKIHITIGEGGKVLIGLAKPAELPHAATETPHEAPETEKAPTVASSATEPAKLADHLEIK